MLSKYNKLALSWMQFFYKFLYQVPIKWDPVRQMISINSEKRKWIYWWTGNGLLFLLWLSCIYTVSTQPFLKRQSFGILQLLVVNMGLGTLGTALFGAIGINALRNAEYIDAINYFLHFELHVVKSKLFSIFTILR